MDFLDIIRRVIAEHQLLRERENRVGQSVNDIEAVFNLQRAASGWSQGSVETLVEQHNKLQETFGILDRGLNGHFAFEEDALPPIFGNTLTQALLVEHGEIKDKVAQARATLRNTRFEGLTREQLWTQKAAVQQMVFNMNKMIEEHAGREEVILRMIEKALQKTTGGSETGQ